MSRIWEQVHQLNQKSLFTLARGKGTLRWVGRDQIEHIAGLNLDKSQLTPPGCLRNTRPTRTCLTLLPLFTPS